MKMMAAKRLMWEDNGSYQEVPLVLTIIMNLAF